MESRLKEKQSKLQQVEKELASIKHMAEKWEIIMYWIYKAEQDIQLHSICMYLVLDMSRSQLWLLEHTHVFFVFIYLKFNKIPT